MVVRPRICCRHFVRRDRAVLPAVDDPGQLPRRPAFVVDPGGRHELLEQAQLIVGVQNREVRFQPDKFGMATQQFHADRMECAKPWHAFNSLAQQPPHPFLHLARGLVGESHRKNLVRAGAPSV